MKKILILSIVLSVIVGCRNNYILHTYYGDFNTDTLKVLLDNIDGSSCYLVHVDQVDSFNLKKGGTIYIKGSIEVYYNPQKSIYYKKYPASGNSNGQILRYNPYDKIHE